MKATSYTIGDRIWFAEEKKPYTIRACNDRYLVCTKPFNLKRTYLYTVVDLQLDIRGTDNYRGLGYETDEDCKRSFEMLATGEAEVSHRNRVTLYISRHQSIPTK